MSPNATDENFVATLEGAGSCLKCRYVLPRLIDCATTYFQTGFVRCAECGESVDLWLAALRGALNKLRKMRNAIIHKGARSVAITPEAAMEGLCAAAFGFEFMRYIDPTLLEEKNDAIFMPEDMTHP